MLDGGDVNGEEYVETQYYNGLNCIDKQHHTVSFVVLLCLTAYEAYQAPNL